MFLIEELTTSHIKIRISISLQCGSIFRWGNLYDNIEILTIVGRQMFSSIVQFVEEKDDDRIIGTGDSPLNKSMPK